MTATTQTPATLNAADRCDRCGAQAYVRVTLATGGTLLFCGHHFHDHEPKLRQSASTILDETDRLTQVPSFDDPYLDGDNE